MSSWYQLQQHISECDDPNRLLMGLGIHNEHSMYVVLHKQGYHLLESGVLGAKQHFLGAIKLRFSLQMVQEDFCGLVQPSKQSTIRGDGLQVSE